MGFISVMNQKCTLVTVWIATVVSYIIIIIYSCVSRKELYDKYQMKVIIACVSASTLADVPLVIIVKYLMVTYF